MKLSIILLLTLCSPFVFASDGGLSCTMAYSKLAPLNTYANSSSQWLIDGQKMSGSAVAASYGKLANTPAHSLQVSKKINVWVINIFDDRKKKVGAFSFSNKKGMKVTIATQAFAAEEDEDPTEYNQLEVICSYNSFAG